MATVSTILLSAGDAGDFSDVAGERTMAPKCGSLPRDAGDLVGLLSVNVMLSNITFLSFLLFSMCHSIHVAVNTWLNCRFLH